MRYFLLFSLTLLLAACSAPQLPPVEVKQTNKQISYKKDVEPILKNRCVVCHSCYNSPCQAKFSAYEGIDRGASKIKVYDATRLHAIDPTRLFIDAQSTSEWREKGFFSLTDNLSDTNASYNDSIMLQLLHAKKIHPEITDIFDPENDKLTCAKDKKELSEYLYKKPQGGMPYGYPALSEKEYRTLAAWLHQGAQGPSLEERTKSLRPSPAAQKMIRLYESFLNAPDIKHRVTARYLYEHLYLAHTYFPAAPGEFFQLVRSYTPAPKPIKIIPSVRPFDDPGVERFYYRLQKVHSVIVHKTHMVVKFDAKELEWLHRHFIAAKWNEAPHLIGYDTNITSNPLAAFAQIPAQARSRFLLRHSRFIVMTFIKGPVCRGQMALNVIHDHFWVMFKDPDHDITVLDQHFIDSQAHNLELPIYSVDMPIIKTFSDEYRKRYKNYYIAKKAQLEQRYPNGFTLDSIWKGERAEDAPLLTIYRHFDSASVSRGVLGDLPRTMWVIDFAQFERLYYTLVAGYDVFGNVSHQTNIRRYMDFLRIEGELNFLEYLPKKVRYPMLKSWYINDSLVDDYKYDDIKETNTGIHFHTSDPKREFIEMVVQHHLAANLHITFDPLNYKKAGEKHFTMPKSYKSASDYIQAARSITLPGSGFVRFMTDKGANNLLLRIDMPDGTHIAKDLVINRWHDNVNSLFTEELTLNPSKDTMDILDHFVGSYPNVFIIVKFEELPEFLELMKNTTGSDADIKKFKHFFISRSDPRFWEIFEWFQHYYDVQEGVEAGLYDLNRYAREPWERE